VLNLCLIATAAIPRGGTIDVFIEGEGDATSIRVEAKGANARVAHGVPQLLDGRTAEGGTVDAHGIQAYYTGLVARAAGLSVSLNATSESVLIEALPGERAAAEPGEKAGHLA